MAYQITDRLHFLVEASRILSSSLDYNVTLANVAKLITDNMADFCMIDLLDENGIMQRVAARVGDPKKTQLANRMFNFPADPRNTGGIYDTARGKETVLIKEVTDSWLRQVAKINEERKVLKELGISSLIYAPLLSRGKTIGVLTLVSSKKGFSYADDDALLAAEIASRAGMAVDKAQLYLQAQEALRIREEFMSIAAHELRTPLTIILLHLQKANSDMKKLMSKHTGMEQILELLERSEKQGFRLSKMINDLLDVSLANIEKLPIEKESIELNSLVEEEVKRFRLKSEGKSKLILKKSNKEIFGNWDEVRLGQVISNLLSNALKYGNNKPISISVLKEKKKAIIKVKDNGIGIKNTDTEKIFDLFGRANLTDTKGIGIGLYITNKIIEAHGGKVEVDSKIGKGTTFKIILPLSV